MFCMSGVGVGGTRGSDQAGEVNACIQPGGSEDEEGHRVEPLDKREEGTAEGVKPCHNLRGNIEHII